MGSRREFYVHSVDPTGGVIGRNDNADIPLGTMFTVIRKVRVDGDLRSLQSIDLGVAAPIELALKEVEWYRRSLDFVPAGHTARLTVAGSGFEKLISALQTASERECISIADS